MRKGAVSERVRIECVYMSYCLSPGGRLNGVYECNAMWELEIVREREIFLSFSARVRLSHMEFSAADGFCHLTYRWANEDLCEITPDSTLNPSASISLDNSRAQLFQQKKRKKAEITTQIIIMGFNRRLSSSSLQRTQKNFYRLLIFPPSSTSFTTFSFPHFQFIGWVMRAQRVRKVLLCLWCWSIFNVKRWTWRAVGWVSFPRLKWNV